MRHAQQHAETRTKERRRRLAQEAARLMVESGLQDFAAAKRKAAERLGIHEDASLPRNREVQEALLEHQRLFHGNTQPMELRKRRQTAIEAMAALQEFDPLLVGTVLDGSADQHSTIELHAYSDDPLDLDWFLSGRGIPFESSSRRYRLDPSREAEFPSIRFCVDDFNVEISVFPTIGRRQAPLDRIDGRPMARATREQLAILLDESTA